MALNRQNLALLQEKYLSMKQVRTKSISFTEEEIVKKEEEIIKKFEDTTGREVVAMTHLAFDLEKLKEMISNGVHTMSIDVLIGDLEELEKEIDAIDAIKDSETKLVKVNDLKTHKSLESIVRIHDTFTD
jgi:formyltetrahydrofolate synthetase